MSQKNFSSFGDLETLIAEIVSKISGKVDKVSGKGLSTNDYTTADKNKVDALKSASTKDVPTSGNASSSQVVMGNDSRLNDSRNAKDVYSWAKAATKPTYTANEVGAIPTTQKGTASGVAELDANGKVPSSQLPSYVDDTVDGYLYNSKWYSDEQHTHEVTGESGKIYVELSTNKTYRWSGSGFVEISESLALGETSSTAYRGDRGKTAYDHSQLTSGNPHNVSKSDVGLGNVPNVSTNDQTPTFTEASTRNNIASGEKLSVIFGKIQKFYNDLKTVAFTGSFSNLSNKPQINSVELSGNKTAGDLRLQSELTFDNVPTDGSNNPVKSDGIYDSEKDIYAVMGQMGAKNRIPYPYYETSDATRNGVSYTLNGQSVTVNRESTSSSNANFWLYGYGIDFMGLKSGHYILSGSGSSEVTVALTYYNNNTWVSQINATTEDVEIEIDTENETYNNIGITVFVSKSNSPQNVTIKPMLRLASDTDDTYQPYAKTNRELTESYPANKVMMSDGVTSVEDAVDKVASGLKNLIGSSTITKTTNERGSFVLNTNARIIGIYIDTMPSGGSYTYRLGQAGNTVYLHLMDEEGNDATNITITVTYYTIAG